MVKIVAIGHEEAERIAISGLSYLASEGESLSRFLSLTGLSAETIRASASSQSFLAAVLDFIVSQDALLAAFAESLPSSPETIEAARLKLSDKNGDEFGF